MGNYLRALMSSSLPLPMAAVIGIWLGLYLLTLVLHFRSHARLRQVAPEYAAETAKRYPSPFGWESLLRFFASGLLIGASVVSSFIFDDRLFVFFAGGQLLYCTALVGLNFLGLQNLKNPKTANLYRVEEAEDNQKAGQNFFIFLLILFVVVGLLVGHLSPLGAAFFLLIAEARPSNRK
jgi:hypothetical protein